MTLVTNVRCKLCGAPRGKGCTRVGGQWPMSDANRPHRVRLRDSEARYVKLLSKALARGPVMT